MASKTSFYNTSGVTNEQSNAIDASVSNAEASATSASNSATAAANSASSASASAATATTSKDAAVVAKDAAVVAKNAAEAAAGGASGALGKSNNLSDLTNASTARSNLGVAIGSDVQAYSSILQSTTAAYTSALNTKLSGIEANATADQTKSDIDALGINATSVSGFTVGKSVPSNAVFTDTNTTYSVGDGGLTQNNFTNADHTKLDGIEASADVTDTANVVAALTAGSNITIASDGTIASTASGGTSYTHPNHSGEVTSTGDGATVIASNVVDADNLKVTGNGSNTQFLRSDGDGTFTWATPVDTNTTYTVGDGALTQKNFTTALKTKLDGIATGATAYTNANAISAVTGSDLDMNGNKVLFSNVYSALSDLPSASSNHGMFAHVHATGKGYYAHGGNWIELANASDIVNYTVQDGQLSQNNFTDADHSKLNAIEANATADQTASEIRTLVESATDSNVFTDADHTKLNAIEAGANVTDTANVVASLTAGTNITIASDGTIASTASGGGGGADLYAANESSPSAQPSATGANAIAIGDSAVASGTKSLSTGAGTAAGWGSVALGHNTSTAGSYAVAIGANSSGGASIGHGHGSLALGGGNAAGASSVAIGTSRATGTHSFAAAIQSTSTSYGASGHSSIAIGYQAKTTVDGINSVAIGNNAVASGSLSVAIGRNSSSGLGQDNLAMAGGTINSSKSHCMAIGEQSIVEAEYGVALGTRSKVNSIGKFAYQGQPYNGAGHTQMGLVNITADTTDATPKVLSARKGQNLDIAQMNIPDNSCYTFTGTVSGREKASEGTDVGGWEVKGVIRREGSASTTTLVNSVINDINVPTGWAVAVSADTTNGALSVTVTGVASTNIKWIATIYTSEVTYA